MTYNDFLCLLISIHQVFETERLVLRKVDLSDARDIFEYASDEETVKYVSGNAHQSIDETKEGIVNYFLPNRLITWGIIDKENNKLIGTIDLRIKNKQASFGWMINKKYWGKGITFEAASCLKKFAFNFLEVEVISCIHDIDNPNSGRVMEKLGMNKLGHVWKYQKGENRLMAYWAITQKEYKDKKRKHCSIGERMDWQENRIRTAINGTNPMLIKELEGGYLVFGDTQFLPGYCVLLPKREVSSLNDLTPKERKEFLFCMSLVGDALLDVCKALRVNYDILGNTDNFLHAHIFPRYDWEEEERLKKPVWLYNESNWFNSDKLYDFYKHEKTREDILNYSNNI